MDASEKYEKWHKDNLSKNQITQVKKMLKGEFENVTIKGYLPNSNVIGMVKRKRICPIPITHNKGKIYLQFCGWSINLYDDGTWCWEDTTGG